MSARDDNLARGRRAPHRANCRCPACRWRRRAATTKGDRTNQATIAPSRPGQRLSALEYEGARREAQLEGASSATIASATISSTSPTPSSTSSRPAAAGDSKFPEVTPTPVLGGGSQEFSPGASAPSAQGPGSPQVRDVEVAEAVVSPQVTGPALQCNGCDQVVPAADQSAHSRACRTQPQHEAMKWRPWRPAAPAPAPPAVTLLRHFCGAIVPVAQRAGHRCPPGTPQHWGLTAEEWSAA